MLLQGGVALDHQLGHVLLEPHHDVRGRAGQRHRVHQDGFRQPDRLLDGHRRGADQQPDPIRCSSHAVKTALTGGQLQAERASWRARVGGKYPGGHAADCEHGDPGCRPTAAVSEPVTGKRVLLAEPRGYCAGVDRAVETVERALEKHGAAGLRPARDRAQPPRGGHAGQGRRGVRRRDRRGARGRDRGVLRPRRRADRARDGRRASAEGHRRHLPAGHQGAQRGQAIRPRRLRHPADRPRGPRGGRRHRRRSARPRAAGRRARARSTA